MTTGPHTRQPLVEVLYVDDCPHYGALVSRLRDLLAGAGVDAEPTSRRVASDGEARALRFLGSPTLRLDGCDVEPGAGARTDYGLGCRLYRAGDGVAGTPPDTLILAALDAWRAGTLRSER